LTYKDLTELIAKFHDWYFDNGSGMYLSYVSKEKLFELKIDIINLIRTQKIDIQKIFKNEKDPLSGFSEEELEIMKKELEPTQLKNLADKGTKLRRSLANDVGAARENKIIPKTEIENKEIFQQTEI
jgi:hypothetical protein